MKFVGHTFVYSRGHQQHSEVTPFFERSQAFHLRRERDNLYDPNAVVVLTTDGKHVNRIAWEISEACSDLMRAEDTHDFQIRAFYDHFEEEVVIKRSGARYTATRIVIKLELYGDDVDLVSNLVDYGDSGPVWGACRWALVARSKNVVVRSTSAMAFESSSLMLDQRSRID